MVSTPLSSLKLTTNQVIRFVSLKSCLLTVLYITYQPQSRHHSVHAVNNVNKTFLLNYTSGTYQVILFPPHPPNELYNLISFTVHAYILLWMKHIEWNCNSVTVRNNSLSKTPFTSHKCLLVSYSGFLWLAIATCFINLHRLINKTKLYTKKSPYLLLGELTNWRNCISRD